MKLFKQRAPIGFSLTAGIAMCITTMLTVYLMPLSALAAAPSPAVSIEDVLRAVEKVSPIIEEVGLKVWNISEPSLREVKSSEYLKGICKKNGFKITSEGSGGVPTAFIAEFGSGKPVIGIMLEYDALPGLGNEAVPYKEPRKDGNTYGHACGHNLIGSGALGAALAIKSLMAEKKITGTLRVYGAASEETEGAKVYMARAGLFNDVETILHWHPHDVALVANVRSTAMSQMYIEFRGKASHAGNAPWQGRSALDALEIFLHGVNMMMEHVEPTARIHYVIKNGGLAPNIVPDVASAVLWYRDADIARVEKSVAWLKDIAKGAALATQTKELAVDYFGVYDLLPNTPLAERMQRHFAAVGLPQYTDKEIDFAKSIQKAAGVKPTGMAKTILPIPNETKMGGSSDVGDVSWLTPTMGLLMPTIPEGISVHTWMATASHGMSIGNKGAIATAKVLALTGIDLLTDPELLKRVRADFEKRTRGFVYKSPISETIKEPVGLPDNMRHHQSILELKESFFKQAGDDQLHKEEGK